VAFPRARTTVLVLVVGVLLGGLAGLGAGLGLARSTVASTAEILVSVGPGIQGSADAVATEDQYLSNRMTTYAALAVSDRVLGPAAGRLGTTAGALRPLVTVSAGSSGNVLDVSARAATPEAAVTATRAVDDALVPAIVALETRPGQTPPVTVAVVSTPSVPDSPFAPGLGPAAAAGAVAGLVLALLAVVARATGLPQRATRALLRWVFSVPAPPERVVPGPPVRVPPGPPGPVVPREVPEQVRAGSAADAEPARAETSPAG
jgi:capsular polysaccharide biosynthesis protein